MKRLSIFPVIFLLLFSSCEYNSGMTEAFAKYKFKDGVTSITVPGWVIGIASRWGDFDKEQRELMKSISKIKVLTIEDNALNTQSNFHKEFYQSIRKNPEMEELMVVRNVNDQITIFGKASEKSIEELLILVSGTDNAIVYVKGNIKPEMLSDLINKNQYNDFLSWQN